MSGKRYAFADSVIGVFRPDLTNAAMEARREEIREGLEELKRMRGECDADELRAQYTQRENLSRWVG